MSPGRRSIPVCRGSGVRRGCVTLAGMAKQVPTPQAATLPKSSDEIERCVISTFQVAESMGFKGEFRQWEHSATHSQIGLRSPDFLRNSGTRRCECLCNHMKPTITKRLNISQ